MKALFLYSSREGQTKKILQYIEEQLPSYQCDVKNLHDVDTVDFSSYDKVLIGASIRYGHLNQKLYQFIQRNLAQLDEHKVAFLLRQPNRKKRRARERHSGGKCLYTNIS